MIVQTIRQYDFEQVTWNSPGKENECFDPRFLIRFRARPEDLHGELLSHPCGFSIAIWDKAKGSPYHLFFDRRQQNYTSVRDPDGGCRVMECSLKTGEDPQPWKIGFPLALAGSQSGEHEFAVLFDGVYFQILCDGIVMDRECPEGEPPHLYERPAACTVFSPALSSYSLTNDLSGIRRTEREIRRDIPIQYYTPFGFNTWVGDVVPFCWKGRFHIFYLFDRRHHGSRRGKGAHEFWHLSSGNFRDWIDHGPVTEVAAQWQTVGTGTMFFHKGKYYYCHGYHTNRMLPNEKLASVLLSDGFERRGYVESVPYAEIEKRGLFPDGANYIVSENGVDFVSGGKEFHWAENPGIYSKDENTLVLYCGFGTWEAEGIDGKWRLKDPSFPPSGKTTSMKNTAECPSFFEWNGYRYLMMGWTGFWRISGEKWICRRSSAW